MITRLVQVGLLALVPLAAATPSIAQSPGEIQALRKEIESLRATQLAIQKDVQEIKAILQKLTAPPPSPAPTVGVALSLDGAQVKGAADAKVAVVEFSDYHCPYCRSYAAETFPQISHDYVQTGKVRYVFIDFPLESLHPLAFKAHEAAACAADQGRFWEMHDRLFANQRAAAGDALAGHAAAIGLDTATFRACLDGGSHAADIRRALKTGQDIGVRGTPTFLIGLVGADRQFKAVRMLSGAQPYAVFKEAIEGVLAASASEGAKH